MNATENPSKALKGGVTVLGMCVVLGVVVYFFFFHSSKQEVAVATMPIVTSTMTPEELKRQEELEKNVQTMLGKGVSALGKEIAKDLNRPAPVQPPKMPLAKGVPPKIILPKAPAPKFSGMGLASGIIKGAVGFAKQTSEMYKEIEEHERSERMRREVESKTPPASQPGGLELPTPIPGKP